MRRTLALALLALATPIAAAQLPCAVGVACWLPADDCGAGGDAPDAREAAHALPLPARPCNGAIAMSADDLGGHAEFCFFFPSLQRRPADVCLHTDVFGPSTLVPDEPGEWHLRVRQPLGGVEYWIVLPRAA